MENKEQNLWWATGGERTPAAPLSGSVSADVAVIGAGILGATAALALSEAGVRVAVIEAGEVGEGASSRPGGFVVPHFSVGPPDAVRARVGDKADGLIEMVGRSAAGVFDLIRRYGIACDARQGGWHHPAHSVSALADVRRTLDQWHAAGFAGELLDANEVARRTGARGYLGGWFAPDGGTLHPLRYCRGLMDAALARGATLFEHSRAVSITAQGARYRVSTSGGGSVLADQVLVCTNGLSSELVPQMTASIVPLKVWQCATEPLPEAWRAHLFAAGECLSDTRRNLFTYRFDAEGRLITGALDAVGVSPRRAGAIMARRLSAMLGLPGVPRVQYLWTGSSSLSAQRLPASLVKVGGVISASACNARGIALSTMVGLSLARYLKDGVEPPVPVLGGGATSARLQSRLSRFYPHFAPVLDWIDARRSA